MPNGIRYKRLAFIVDPIPNFETLTNIFIHSGDNPQISAIFLCCHPFPN